jgi:hypothetical protein
MATPWGSAAYKPRHCHSASQHFSSFNLIAVPFYNALFEPTLLYKNRSAAVEASVLSIPRISKRADRRSTRQDVYLFNFRVCRNRCPCSGCHCRSSCLSTGCCRVCIGILVLYHYAENCNSAQSNPANISTLCGDGSSLMQGNITNLCNGGTESQAMDIYSSTCLAAGVTICEFAQSLRVALLMLLSCVLHCLFKLWHAYIHISSRFGVRLCHGHWKVIQVSNVRNYRLPFALWELT